MTQEHAEEASERNSNCQICEKDVEVLEHHISYRDRYGLHQIEIVVDICMDCHHRVHKEDGFHDEMNPVELNDHMEYEDFVVGLIESSELDFRETFGNSVDGKFVACTDNTGTCETQKNSGEICGRDLPCQYHGSTWVMKQVE